MQIVTIVNNCLEINDWCVGIEIIVSAKANFFIRVKKSLNYYQENTLKRENQ